MKILHLLAITGLFLVMSITVASADTKPSASSKMSTSILCPVCHMPMTTTKTSVNTEALLVHGKKYYCCSMCAAGKKAAAYDKAHPGKFFVAEK